jgi:hypothetical protein
LFQYNIGGLLFPLLEPIYRIIENSHKDIRQHFHQAIVNIERSNLSVALLNLNMVLSLHPRHFLARVYRGRIYIQQSQYQLASEDYVLANQISHYRFVHYDLYREYLRSVNIGIEKFGASIIQNFTQAFEVLRQAQEKLIHKGHVKNEGNPAPSKAPPPLEAGAENDLPFIDEAIQSNEELSKFKKMGPITQKEIEENDWDKFLKQLNS